MTACMMLKGVIDTEKERERLQKKQESVLQFKTRLEAKTTDANYASKVPADVRQVNADKLSGYENELAALDKALVALARMEV
ncbi:Valyl-tRNA synthetase tRNA-binding arm [Perkinsela sp. CCAP 1560/4]|nr:Valyl-tRNA synthetase tRNA-binding arm [Perkinsela sp. CCAP 1560/4]|eukprot:KNH03986.1 Valyl-tRNA synthetase tRNA-binding arm [Perkinsela sp. CCAP 1560/4]